MKEGGATVGVVEQMIVVYVACCVSTYFFFYKFISYIASYLGPIQTGFLRGFQKSYIATGIMVPVKKVPQERKTQELPTVDVCD